MLRHRPSEISVGAIFIDTNARRHLSVAGVLGTVRTAGVFEHTVSGWPAAGVARGFDGLAVDFAELGNATVRGRLGFLRRQLLRLFLERRCLASAAWQRHQRIEPLPALQRSIGDER